MEDKHEKLGQAIDRVENIIAALKLPLTPSLHLQGVRESLPSILKQLKEGFVESTGENPWGQ